MKPNVFRADFFKKALSCCFALALVGLADPGLAAPVVAPPGSYHTSWIGNSFGGNGAPAANPNGFGYWVQDNVAAMAVSDDGTVFLGTGWDEAGRTVGLYKNGVPNDVLVTAERSRFKAWGFNTGNHGLCVSGSYFYLATAYKGSRNTGLLRFRWTPGDINSAQYVDETALPQPAVSLSCDRGNILVSYPNELEVRDATSLRRISAFPIADLSFALTGPNGSFWVIAGGAVRRLDAAGRDTGVRLAGIGDPASLAWGHTRLIVTDNGPAQQVLFYDVTGQPKRVASFGIKGGLYAGVPGAVAPLKLFALAGAGMDRAGNLYVAMSFSKEPGGNTFLRAFSPQGELLWQDYAAAFVDTFGFQPGSGGSIVFGRTTRWQLDLAHQTPGSEASLTAITLDPLKYPNDPRLVYGMSAYPRLLDGRQLLYCLAQNGGLFIFAGAPGSEILHEAVMAPQTGWGWSVTDDGDIWNADAPGNKIALYALASLNAAGVPVYPWAKPASWAWPAGFQKVTRVIYQRSSDSLYVFGYLKGQRVESWGVVGFTARRYDGWMTGKPVLKWTNASLPASPDGLGRGKALSAKAAAFAGDYIFLGMVRVSGAQARVNILNARTGRLVGTLMPGPEVGGVAGAEDIIGSVQATRSADGEYLILVEDDWRAKNLLFRWKP